MSLKGKAVVSITTLIKAARAAKSDSTKVEPYQDGTTYVQYLVKDADTEGHLVFTPTRRWPSLPEGTALVYKDLAGAIFGHAQWDAAHPQLQPDGFFACLGTAPEALETPEATLGFGRDDRIMEVGLTSLIQDLLVANASLSGEEHVNFFKGKTERRKAERAAYRTLNDPAIALLVKALREQD
jgi:hypothetical protein